MEKQLIVDSGQRKTKLAAVGSLPASEWGFASAFGNIRLQASSHRKERLIREKRGRVQGLGAAFWFIKMKK
ncbi:hypothetical protein [Alloalcanivorax dieselolei]|uniref:hypothetical protein n=1 Tax=Alloalcanivorax dieselolei TaxID=285091 RepID=UPI0011D1BA05|nr:hypothetical protein [Alloalcanivorax dieselolei]